MSLFYFQKKSKLIEIIKIIFVKFSRNIFLKNVLYKKFGGEAEGKLDPELGQNGADLQLCSCQI